MIVYEAPRLRQGESAEVLGRVKAPPYLTRPIGLDSAGALPLSRSCRSHNISAYPPASAFMNRS